MKGTVKWFNEKKGFGFIKLESGDEIFVHHTSIVMDGFRTLDNGEEVEFTLKETPKGKQAVDVKRA